jgi:hypothetical protein
LPEAAWHLSLPRARAFVSGGKTPSLFRRGPEGKRPHNVAPPGDV